MKRLLLCSTLALATSCSTTGNTPPASLAPTPPPATNPNALPPASSPTDTAFRQLHNVYVMELLRRYPSVNTYLGGSGLDPSLRETDGRLRDFSVEALSSKNQ